LGTRKSSQKGRSTAAKAKSTATAKSNKRSPAKTTAKKNGKAANKSTKTGAKEPAATGDAKVTVDRRKSNDRRKGNDRRQRNEPVAVERRNIERRAKVNRRRQIDPTTCERDYTTDEIEFMNALDEYKRTSGRMFPTCSEILEVIKKLGYAKQPREAAHGVTADADTETPAVASTTDA